MSTRSSSPEPEFSLFAEPADYYPPSPPPTSETFTLQSGQTIALNLVGHNPLWGHHLWNGAKVISTYLQNSPALVKDKTVLELGAGAGLPSLVCHVIGAKRVVVTDYPDPDLVENLRKNVDALLSQEQSEKKEGEERIVAEGYCWGADPEPLLKHLQLFRPAPVPAVNPESETKFDILILADLLFNHSEHTKLVATVTSCLAKRKDAKALVFFTPYRPWLFEKDIAFFDLIREKGMLCEKVLEEKMESVMFENDRGDEEVRRTIYGWVIKWDL